MQSEILIKNVIIKAVENTTQCFFTHGVKFSKKSIIVKNPKSDNGQRLEVDTSGYHDNVVIKFCDKSDCKTTNCADLMKSDPNPCGKTSIDHNNPITIDPKFQHELVGTLIHKIPQGKNGFVIDPITDVNGPHPKGQSVVKEVSKTSINPQEFKENSKTTKYLQTNKHNSQIASNFPKDSDIFKN